MASSVSSSSVFVTQEEFNRFHTIDRELYTLLVINLFRDPAESMRVMALWLWLEQKGFHNVVKKMLSLPHVLINELADEAVTCLTFLTETTPLMSSYDNGDIPLIQCLMEKEISFQFFNDNRQNATHEVANIVNDVCVRALTDIMQQAILINNQSNQILSPPPPTTSFHPGGVNFQTWGISRSSSSSNSNSNIIISTPETGVPPDDRTMFVTFSKGYPVFEWEVREFFTRTYGDCIESLHMQEVQQNEQSLFARIVFHSASTIDVILNGLTKAKFTINGKHVWMRKFVPKRNKSMTSPLPNLPSSFFD